MWLKVLATPGDEEEVETLLTLELGGKRTQSGICRDGNGGGGLDVDRSACG